LEAVTANPLDYNGSAKPAGRNRLVRADALRFLSEATRSGKKWDLIILDPPTFSNSKKMASNLDVRRDYRELLDLTIHSLSPGGILWFSTNARGFTLDPAEFPGIAIEDQTEKTRDEDFKDRKIRSCYTFRP
jgi:23S rRNA G2069 N7-methylase RlmK/C1962 C5-methylase RlmI